VGGHGVAGSANSPLVGVSTLGYRSGPADPLDSEMASATDVQSSADLAQTTSTSTTTTTAELTSRQPPTATEGTAAAFQSPTPIRYEKKCYSDMRSKAYTNQIYLQRSPHRQLRQLRAAGGVKRT